MDIRAKMVLQILTDTFQVGKRSNADAAKLVRVANSRQHKEARRVDCAARHNNLSFTTKLRSGASLYDLNPDRTSFLHDHFGRAGVC
jgi:hypothetical protein